MTTLHLMVGLPCSGKTTLAKKLEKKHQAIRFTPDEWHIALFGYDFGEHMTDTEEVKHNNRHDKIEALMWNLAVRNLTLGLDVILDFGCWSRVERDEFRTRAKKLGVNFKIHFLDVPEEILFERLKIRNAHKPKGTFSIPEKKLREWSQIFEAPLPEELI